MSIEVVSNYQYRNYGRGGVQIVISTDFNGSEIDVRLSLEEQLQLWDVTVPLMS